MDDTIRYALITVIKSRRQKLSRAERGRGIKPTRWLYPCATENRYAATIRAWFRPMKEYVNQYIKDNHEAILHGDSAEFRDDSISVDRLDAVPGGSFIQMINSLNGWMGQYAPEQGELFDEYARGKSPIYLGLGKIADSTFDFNEGQYEKGAKSALGIEFPVGELWWPDARKIWQQRNYDIIRSDMRNYIAQVNDLTEKAVTSGLSVKELSKQIQALDSKISKGRANFIARDQIGKLNGQITHERMEAVGLSMYIWETAGDERVRSTHAPLDGKLCRWDDSTVYSDDGGRTWKSRPDSWCQLHPGEDYQCRCTAIAYWEELVGEADAQIDEQQVFSDNEQPEQLVPEKQNNVNTPKLAPPLKPIPQTPGSSEKEINAKLSELKDWGKKNKKEQASIMTVDGKVLCGEKGKESEVIFSSEMAKALVTHPANSLLLLHNHPKSTSFSKTDIELMCKFSSIKELRVVGSNGKTYRASVGNGKRPSLAEMEEYEQKVKAKLKQECANMQVMGKIPKGESTWSLYLSKRNKALAENFGWEYKEGKLGG